MANPRLQVVLPPEVYHDLSRIARYSDTSMSALVARMVVEGAELLHQLADTLEQAHGLSVKLPGAVQAKLSAIDTQLQAAADEAQLGLDMIQNEVAAHVEEHGSEAPPRASEGGRRGGVSGPSEPPPKRSAPPYINKGVKR